MQRAKNKFEYLKNNQILNIDVQVGLPNQNNIMEWKCIILGPQDTPFGGRLPFF